MSDLEQIILREIAALPESRRADVLAFVRFLKISLQDDERLKFDFQEALKNARRTAGEYKIDQEAIDAEIRAVREGK